MCYLENGIESMSWESMDIWIDMFVIEAWDISRLIDSDIGILALYRIWDIMTYVRSYSLSVVISK